MPGGQNSWLALVNGWHRARILSVRNYSTAPPPRDDRASRLDRLTASSPASLRPYIIRLRSAPFSHISAFLILHEITALVSLGGFAYAFHTARWLPEGIAEWRWVRDGAEKYGKYLRKKGWLEGSWSGDAGVRLVLEVATAYAITKVLMPVRLAVSLWATPAFARIFIEPLSRVFGRR